MILLPGMTSLFHQFPYAGIFLLLVSGAVGLPFPEDATFILCGVLILQGTVHLVPAFLSAYSGALAGDFIIFTLGRNLGRRLLRFRRFRSILSEEKIVCFEDRFRRSGPLLILLGRQVPGLRAQVILLSGVMGFQTWRFFFIDSLAASVTVIIMMLVGYTGGTWFFHLREEGVAAGSIAVIAGITTFLGFLVVRRYRKGRGAELSLAPNHEQDETGRESI